MSGHRGISFRTLLGTSFFGIIALCLALAYAMQIRFVEGNGLAQIKAHAESQTESIAQLLQMDLMSGFYPAVVQRANRTMQLQAELLGLRIETKSGYIVFDSAKKDLASDQVLTVTKKVLPSTLAGQQAAEADWIASITAQFSVQDHMALMKRQRRTIAAFGFALALLGLALSAFVSAALSGPIRRLALEMKRGDLEALEKLAPDAASRWIYELHDLYAQTHFLAGQNLQYQGESLRRAKELALAEFARQVAHDIRSPLAALETAAADLSHASDEKRLLVRGAAGRIRDIANSLLENYRDASGGVSSIGAPAERHLLTGLIEPVISEKRLQFRPRPDMLIEAVWDERSYGVFGTVKSVEFSRVLSNLINNGVESIEGASGTVQVTLSVETGFALVTIRDNGKGIPPDILARLGERGASHGKAQGFGLGLHHARVSCESWGGKLSISSQPGEGTQVTVSVPVVAAPKWFAPRLTLRPAQTVVILDDDASIHQVWADRFKSDAPAEIVHCFTPIDLRSWIAANKDKSDRALFLLDYELKGHKETGLELAEEFKLGTRSMLVTSWYEDATIIERCLKAGLRIIPKGLARLVPIERPVVESLDAALIDDDPLARATWTIAASRAGKRLAVFTSVRDFLSARIDLSTPVYIDADLGDGIDGALEAKRLHERGYTELYLATGHPASKFPDQGHLKGIQGKAPPWIA